MATEQEKNRRVVNGIASELLKMKYEVKQKRYDAYSILQLEQFLNQKKKYGLRLVESKNRLYFSKSKKLDFQYFVLIEKFEYKMPLDRSSPELLIDSNFIDSHLMKSNISYNVIYNKKSIYVYEINGISSEQLNALKEYRYFATVKLFRQECSILIPIGVILFAMAALNLFSNIAISVLCFFLISIISIKIMINLRKIRSILRDLT